MSASVCGVDRYRRGRERIHLQHAAHLVVRAVRSGGDGGDVRAVDERGRQQARAHKLTVHEDTARAADPNAAPFLGAGQAELVTQQVDQAQVREAALADAGVQRYVEGKPVRKFVYVPGKLANVVV